MELARDRQERELKERTSESAHWKNRTHKDLPFVRISKAVNDPMVIRNFRLFNIDAIEQLMTEIDAVFLHAREKPLPVGEMLAYRPGR